MSRSPDNELSRKRDRIIRKLQRLDTIAQVLDTHNTKFVQDTLSNSKENNAAKKLDTIMRFNSKQMDFNRKIRVHQVRLTQALFVEDIIRSVVRTKRNFEANCKIGGAGRGLVETAAQQTARFECQWKFWNDTLNEIENSNKLVLECVKSIKSDSLERMFVEEMANFRTMGKLYSTTICEAIVAQNCEDSELAIFIGIDDLSNHWSLKRILRKLTKLSK